MSLKAPLINITLPHGPQGSCRWTWAGDGARGTSPVLSIVVSITCRMIPTRDL